MALRQEQDSDSRKWASEQVLVQCILSVAGLYDYTGRLQSQPTRGGGCLGGFGVGVAKTGNVWAGRGRSGIPRVRFVGAAMGGLVRIRVRMSGSMFRYQGLVGVDGFS